MSQKFLLVLVISLINLVVACGKKDTTPPRMAQSWSWAYEDKNQFPQITGQAYYAENHTQNILPVKLEPNREYVIWINTSKFKNFKDKSGNSAVPFKFTFKTK